MQTRRSEEVSGKGHSQRGLRSGDRILSSPVSRRAPWLDVVLAVGATALGYGLHFGFIWAFYEKYRGHSLSEAQSEEFTRAFWFSLAGGALTIIMLATLFGRVSQRSTEAVIWVSVALAIVLFWPYLEFVSNVILPA